MRALIYESKVLILDEPTTGLDPYTRKLTWKMLQEIRKEKGLTFFLTTHYMKEIAAADEMMIMYSGKIKAYGTSEALRVKYRHYRLLVTTDNAAVVSRALSEMNKEFQQDRERICIPINRSFEALKIIEKIKKDIRDFEVIRGTMDDAFINIMIVFKKDKISDMLEMLKGERNKYHSVLVGKGDGNYVLIDMKDIVYFNAYGNDTFVNTAVGEQYKVKYKLYELEGEVLPENFMHIRI